MSKTAAASTGQFTTVLADQGPDSDQISQSARFDTARHIVQVDVATSGSDAVSLRLIYTANGVLMRNKAFDAVVHKPWVRFTSADLAQGTGLNVDLSASTGDPAIPVLEAASEPATVLSKSAALTRIGAQVPRQLCLPLLGTRARQFGQTHSLSGTVPVVVGIDPHGFISTLDVDLTPVITDIARITGDMSGISSNLKVTYSLRLSELGQPVNIMLPSPSAIAPAPK